MPTHKKLIVSFATVLFFWLTAACGDDDEDTTVDAHDMVTFEVGDFSFDQADDTAVDQAQDVVAETLPDAPPEEAEHTIDRDVVGVFSFTSAVLFEQTVTPEFQHAPVPGSPDRQVAISGALILHLDGTYVRVLKLMIMEDPDAEIVFEGTEEDQLVFGNWWVEGDTMTRVVDGGETAQANYRYNDTTGVLTLEATEPSDLQTLVWQREELNENMVGDYVFVSMELIDGTVVTTENTTFGDDERRVEGALTAHPDGFFERLTVMFVNDVATEDFGGNGIYFNRGSLLVTEQPFEVGMIWRYNASLSENTLVMTNQDTGHPLQVLTWERRGE